ncbi:unnamed protein product [Meganyctiphanes norvegica]|uniref:F-box domain-containing protein n=1 Tax=Meganyctiphanes norvegica TaxID=48144 RepID=A0AAV2S307_MEGNR
MDLNENCNLSGRKSVLCPPHNAFIPSDEEGFVRQPIPYRDYDLSPVDPKLPSIHVLVDDVLIKILEYLSLKKRIHCEIICRRWQALLYGMFQSTTEISLPESYFDDVSKPMLSKILLLTGKKLKSLTLISIDYTLKMKLFLTIAQLCPNLEYLDVSNLQNLYFDHVGDLKDCKNLRIFSANKCLNLNDTSFKELITVLPGLEKIFIESTELTGDYFDLLPEGLKELNINSCLRVSTENLHKVCRACKNLEILEIEILDIDKEFYEELGVNCTNLRSLKVFFLGPMLMFPNKLSP